MNRFGRSTSHHSALASAIGAVGVVGQPRVDLDRDPAVDAVGARRRRGAARRRPSGRRTWSARGPPRRRRPPRTARSSHLLVVRVALGERLRKIVGLVVTPTTCLSRDSSARLPVRSRSRERSSSQTATPASESRRAVGHGHSSIAVVRRLRVSRCAGREARRVRLAGRPAAVGADCRAGDAWPPAGDHAVGGEAELLEQHLVVGALAPKCSRLTIAPASPTSSRQPCATPASTLTRALTAGGSTGRGRRGPARRTTRGTASTRRGSATPSASSALAGRDGELHLGAGGDEDHVAASAARRPRPGRSRPGRRPRRRRAVLAAVEGRHVLPGQAQPGRPVGVLQDRAPRRPRSRSRRPGGPRPGRGSPAARPGARPAGGSGRPRRGRSSRASRRR